MDEFSRAVREIAGLDASQIPETEMEELFRVVDADESGAVRYNPVLIRFNPI